MRTFIIAEAGVNHNGSLESAIELVKVAAEAGADAIKFQTFQADKLASQMAAKAAYQLRNTDVAESQNEMLKKLELSANVHLELRNICNAVGIEFMSSPFDIESLHFLVKDLGMQKVKVPSGELTNAPFLLEVARTGRQIVLSSGMATLGDIEKALGILAFGIKSADDIPSEKGSLEAMADMDVRLVLRERVTLLHCTTDYPASFDEVNLNVIPMLHQAFGLPIGYSDHTDGIVISLAAVAMGAQVIEKHFTLDKNLPGPDHKASLEPQELRELVRGIRLIERAKGQAIKSPTQSELKNATVARKSLVASRPIQRGEKYTSENICIMRPGTGASPMKYWEYIANRSAPTAYERGDLIE